MDYLILTQKIPKINDNKIIKDIDNNKADKIIKIFSKSNKSKNNQFKNSIYISNIRVIRKKNFLTLKLKKKFNHLKEVFIKV